MLRSVVIMDTVLENYIVIILETKHNNMHDSLH